MMDREKVINGLEQFITDFKPYCGNEADWLRVYDALALLKAQEPRVISWQDAESMRLCWIETMRPHTISPADLIHYFGESPTITVFKIHQNAIDWPLDEYGIKWRCWDKEPTHEQMEREPWKAND